MQLLAALSEIMKRLRLRDCATGALIPLFFSNALVATASVATSVVATRAVAAVVVVTSATTSVGGL